MHSGANTKIHYLYRDADNFKQGRTVILAGRITSDEIELIRQHLEEGTDFIPSQVGLDDLQEMLDNFPNDSDGVWHELRPEDIDYTDKDPTETMTAHEFAEAFRGIIWDVQGAMLELGIRSTEE